MPPKSPKTAQVKGDIRNFFTSISSKTSTSKSPGSAPASKEEDGGKRKKKAMVLVDSTDSESEVPSRSSASTKKPKLDEKPKKESVAIATKSKTKTSIPETPLQPVDISSVFGNKPIKRDIPEKRKRTVIEDHDDEDFEATLQQLDEAPLTKKSKVLEKNKSVSPATKEKAKSPAKEEKSKSPAKEEKSKSLAKEEKNKPSASLPSRNGEKSLKESTRIEMKKETVSDKKRKTSDEATIPKKNTPTKDTKQSEGSDKRSKKELQELDSNSNKASPPKSNKKIKPEPTVVKETPKKRTASQDDDPDVIDSPAFDAIEKRKEKAENYKRFLASRRDGGAKNPGSKSIPEGAPGCMTGLTIVVTGVLESLQREEAEDLVKKYGGKATKSVSKNTSYILAGDDAGPAKLSKAQSMNVPIISEDDFLKMLATRNAAQGSSSPAGKKVPTTPKSKATTSKSIKSEPERVITSVATPTKKRSPDTKKIDSKPKASSSSTTPTKKVEAHRKKPDESEGNGEAKLPWVDKYKPTNLKQVIGMHGDRSIAKKLLYWLKSWYDNRSSTKKLTKPSPWSTNDDGAFFKAALLSGPPGIGKTTTAHLAAKELGYDIVEMNASDTRSKRLLHEHVQELMSSQSLATYAHGSAQIEGGRKRVLVMDEVDGMAGNEDRGGIQELIGLIKTAKIPVICICNDRQHQKIRSLANYCYDLKFSKPRIEQIRGAMLSVCFKEGISLKPEALDEIIMGANQDVRQVLHHLSMLASDKKTLSTEKAKLEASRSKKDMKLGPWEVVKKVFSAEEHRGMSIHDKMGLFFQDYSFGPLFVQENYPYVVPHAAKGNAIKTLDLLGRTAHCMSQTDLIEKVIRSQNAWSLLPVEAVFASVVPGQLMEGYVGSKIEFPSWLGKNSRQNKMDRLLQELQSHMRLRISGSKRALNLDYLPHVLSSIVGPLKRCGADGVEEAIRAMESYDLMREDLDSLLELAQWPHKPDIMAGIEGKVKAAFTRAYNKEGHMTPYAVVQVKKGRSKDTADDQEALVDEDGLAEEDDDEEQSEDPSLDAMIKVKKETKKTAAASAAVTGKKKAPAATRGRGGGSRGGRKKAAE
ncbi:replication factor C subunit 1-like [Daphnia carinata]|uniref:replication factor C subunit 1-like n=1 Tax=Daphnia carinata TaxID=120202 RepID=UPI00257CE774|nr:replication factor C subunit 1-like [Daphnia carinata]